MTIQYIIIFMITVVGFFTGFVVGGTLIGRNGQFDSIIGSIFGGMIGAVGGAIIDGYIIGHYLL